MEELRYGGKQSDSRLKQLGFYSFSDEGLL